MTAAVQLGDAAWLKEGEVARLLAVLDRDGEEARVVGGAVRNELLRLPVAEIDVATTAVPDEVVRRVQAAGWKAVPTGIEHGTVTVVIRSHPFEVTTLREDVETFGRKAKVMFGRDWRADAERRDFTINALSASADGKVFDYVGGLDDIAARRVRFIGDPQQRIAEDYLRILRFFRFHAHFADGAPDAAGLHACITARAGLDTLSRERVRMELSKLFVAPRAAPTLAVMSESGLLGPVLGGVPYLASFKKMTEIEAALAVDADAVRRLGALGVMVNEDAERLAQRLRLSNAESERLTALELLVARCAVGRRASRACAPLSSRPAIVRRPRVARLVARGGRRRRQRLAGACNAAAALDGAGLSAEISRLHPPRRARRPRAWRRHARGQGGVDRGGFSRRSCRDRSDRRARRA